MNGLGRFTNDFGTQEVVYSCDGLIWQGILMCGLASLSSLKVLSTLIARVCTENMYKEDELTNKLKLSRSRVRQSFVILKFGGV